MILYYILLHYINILYYIYYVICHCMILARRLNKKKTPMVNWPELTVGLPLKELASVRGTWQWLHTRDIIPWHGGCHTAGDGCENY